MKLVRLAPGGPALCYHDLPGAGLPLVFLHGLGGAGSTDFPMVAADPALAGRRRILLDLPGFGFSDGPEAFGYRIGDLAAVVAEFVGRLGAAQVDLFGHSMGGSVAIEAARLIGSGVRAVALGEPNLVAGGGLFSRRIAAMTEAAFCAGGQAELARAARAEGNGLWAATMERAAPWALHRAAVSLVEGSRPGWRERLLALDLPRTLICGAASLPYAEFERLPGEGVPLVVVPEAGHLMSWENPAGLATAIAQALG